MIPSLSDDDDDDDVGRPSPPGASFTVDHENGNPIDIH